MLCCSFWRILPVAFITIGLTLGVASAQENFPGLVNLDLDTLWEGPDYYVPGWEWNGGHQFTIGQPMSDIGVTWFSLKFDIAEIGEQTGLLFKEVNWGPVSEISVSIWTACETWGSSSGGQVGIGVDPDGGATGWGDVSYTATITGHDIGWILRSTGTITRPPGADTFTLVLYGHRFDNYWNCHVDDIEVQTDVSFDVPPSVPFVYSGYSGHATGEWSANDDPWFAFGTAIAEFYSYEFDHSPTTIPPEESDGAAFYISYTDIANYDVAGEWWFHVRAGNSYGWSDTAHFGPLLVDDAPPVVSGVGWAPGPEGGVVFSATVTDTGGSPFDIASIELHGNDRIMNGGFESNLIHWATGGSGPFQFNDGAFNPSGPHSGSKNFSSVNWEAIDAVLSQEIAVEESRPFRLRVYGIAGAGQNETSTFALNWIDGLSGGAEHTLDALSYCNYISSYGWELLEGAFTPTGETATVVLRMSAAHRIHIWMENAPWVKVLEDAYIPEMHARGANVFFRPYSAGDEADCNDGAAFAEGVLGLLSSLPQSEWPEAIGYRNEFYNDDVTPYQFIPYYDTLRAGGYEGMICYGSYGVGWPEIDHWDLPQVRAAVAKADAIETHEYFDLTVASSDTWLAHRHVRAIETYPYLLGKPWFIGEMGSANVGEDPLFRVGWQDRGKLTEEEYITQLGYYIDGGPGSVPCADQVVACFLFQQGDPGWWDFEIMGTSVADWVKTTWSGTVSPPICPHVNLLITGLAGLHADDVSFVWYPGVPGAWSAGTGEATWGPMPGINGELVTVVATDGAGNSTAASASTPLSGIEFFPTGINSERWGSYR